jgi:tRNA G10  N-methylase Trm11
MPTFYRNLSERLDSEKLEQYVLIFGFEASSLLELGSVLQLFANDVKLVKSDNSSALVNCSYRFALKLIDRLGGTYKIARVLGSNISEAIREISLPTEPKFNWTISAYNCDEDFLRQCREEVLLLLKNAGLSKSKFLEAEIEIARSAGRVVASEAKAATVQERILLHKPEGFELVIYGGISDAGPVIAQTIQTSDSIGFHRRDMERPFQDPTVTLSPRLSRVLVNLSMQNEKGTILDPFCGLGTILQEGLMCGYSTIGSDVDHTILEKAHSNLSWLKKTERLEKSTWRFLRCDARRISRVLLRQVDGVASEPILVPVYRDNPNRSESIRALERAEKYYAQVLEEIHGVLRQKEDRIALISPTIVDSSGEEHTFSLNDIAREFGFRQYRSSTPNLADVRFPIRIKSAKKRIVQRNLSVFYLGS